MDNMFEEGFYYEKKHHKEYREITQCEQCEGSGTAWAITKEGFKGVTCPLCKGKGKIVEVKTIDYD